MIPPIDLTAKKFFIFISVLVVLVIAVVVFQNNPNANASISVVPQEEQIGVLVESTQYKEYDAQTHNKLLGKLKAELNNPSATDLYGERYIENIKKEIARFDMLKPKRERAMDKDDFLIKENRESSQKEMSCENYVKRGVNTLNSQIEFDADYLHENISKMQKICKNKCSGCGEIELLRNDFSEEGYNLHIMEKKKINIFPSGSSLNKILLRNGIPNDRIVEVKKSLQRTYGDAPENLVAGEYYFYWRKR